MSTRSSLVTTRRVVTGVWVAVNVVQFTVWLVACLVSWHLVNPWWLWSVGVGGVIVGALWWATSRKRPA
ncbi:hypothetical protein [Actinophytocola sp.]|uniref:hypothetical protein n=1 Tax=Actinophytocola sp. TaxID=1872138 RepID=UPI002ED7F7FE